MNKKLKEIAEIKFGYSLRKAIIPDNNGNVHIITPKDISRNKHFCLENVTKINFPNPEKHFIQDKEVLLTSRGNFTAIVFNVSTKSNFIVSSAFYRIKVTVCNFYPEYIALFLNSKIGQKLLQKKQETMTIPSITISQLKEVSIPLIPIVKQRQLINLASSFSKWKILREKQENLQSSFINQIINNVIGEKND